MGFCCLTYNYQLFFFFFCLLSLLFPSSFSSSFSSNPQCSALLHFNNSLCLDRDNSPPLDSFASSFYYRSNIHMCDNSYPKTGSWKEDKDCCSWDGVECDNATRHVIGLDLSCSWLNGSIHSNSSLFLLRHLRSLNLAGNSFNPSLISSEFGNFETLTHLNLSYSYFSGKIPYEISQLSSLVSLDLSYNYLLIIETPVWKRVVDNLTLLRELLLDWTDMSSIRPNSLMNLSSSLTTLSLHDCDLRGKLENNILCLPNIQTLDLGYNFNLEGSLPNSNCNFSSSLKFLDLFEIRFSGELPDSIGSLKSLNHLNLQYCNFTGSIPTSLGSLTQITHLILSSNNFIGPIPALLGNLTQITYLDLFENKFTGPIPSSLGNLTHITYLNLYENMFTGPIPSSLGNLTQMTYLDLSQNSFRGLLPLSLLNLPNLSTLRLYNNQLVGPLPSHICPQLDLIFHLIRLSLSSNSLNGTLPSWLFSLPSLEMLGLDDNEFIGEIGEFKCNSLDYLDLGYNKLQGSIPRSISRLVNLTYLYFFVSNNSLTGEIPFLICNASSLEVLDLSHNSLSGMIPKCLANFSVLSVLDLRMNKLRGTIPATFAKGNKFRNINFNGNQLEGQLPRSLANCRNLEVLDLGNNKINGTFPYWLESLLKLRVLVLRSNRFQGSISNPKTKFPFPNLRIIDISNNQFSGSLPRKYFKYLKAMMNVDESEVGLKYMGDYYYQDSLNVMMKGLYIELVRIQTVFTTIDFSNNRFIGEMPKILGRLKSLKGLNFSHNNLTGYIPSSLGNLTNLEWLDLSFNKLSGEIPMQLAELPWLEVLDLSHNQLIGRIPLGKQFNTFDNDSYMENLGLCGFPLSRTCNNGTKQPTPSTLQKEEPENGFGWQAVSIGYGCGVIFGTLMGYLMFKFGKPKWIVRMVILEQHIMLRRLKNNAYKRGGRK
ncbi:hypothetical protein RGQ29_026997 [Quercus rubra]|uniref:Disease resistance R13L4/SHOC-2-like LRR domain-containing protein n=1 Tax=Quercus rubra TaxID=3512 RepID=A0AAN7IKQ6_QUERU|nr:hypothetical protein RGQ29_026997 [Quercus rubra]